LNINNTEEGDMSGKFYRYCFAVVCTVLLAAVSTAYAGGHKVVKPIVKIAVDPKIEADVIAVVHDTAARWTSQDYASVLGLWDPGEAFPTYLAEEQSQWFVGWDRLRGYLDPPRPNPVIQAMREDMSGIQVKQIGPDLAIAIWYMHFEMKTIAGKPIGEDVRVSAVLRNTDKGWRYIHWAESPKSAPVYLEDLLEKDVRPDWNEFFEQAQKDKKAVWKRKKEQKNK
jgi:hypothetical protein